MIINRGAISGTIDGKLLPPKALMSIEEIEEFYHQFFKLTKTYPNSKKRMDYVNFARAILRKAQEK